MHDIQGLSFEKLQEYASIYIKEVVPKKTKPNKYTNGKIYTLRSPQCEKFYIGSTTVRLSQRLYSHKKRFEANRYMSSFEILKYGDAFIELLEDYPCASKEQLTQREGELQRLHKDKIVNHRIEGRTLEEYQIDNKEMIKVRRKHYRKKYKEKNKEKNKEQLQKYRDDNRLEYNQKMRDYKRANREVINAKKREAYHKKKLKQILPTPPPTPNFIL